jgi:hypothetical protein
MEDGSPARVPAASVFRRASIDGTMTTVSIPVETVIPDAEEPAGC